MLGGDGLLGNSVVVPFGRAHYGVVDVCRLVAAQRPVGHPMAGSISPRHQRAPAGRTDRGGIGLRKEHPLTGQPLHVGRLVGIVEGCPAVPESHRRILPSHIIHHKEDDVGPLLRLSPCRDGDGHRCHEALQKSFFLSHCRCSTLFAMLLIAFYDAICRKPRYYIINVVRLPY